MIGLAYVLSGSRSAAEDLAQEGFLAAHNAWDRVSLYEKPEAAARCRQQVGIDVPAQDAGSQSNRTDEAGVCLYAADRRRGR